MMDAYGAFNLFEKPSTQQAHLAADIWTQLPKETLISRYYDINAAANQRLSERLGKAFEAENLRQTIVFGAGKRCAPNQVHTVACYPMPESPLPDDVYLENTDTIMGVNKYTSLRQRWLNSGYIIGPIGDMRQLFRRAWEKVQKSEDHPEWDNGSNGAEFMVSTTRSKVHADMHEAFADLSTFDSIMEVTRAFSISYWASKNSSER